MKKIIFIGILGLFILGSCGNKQSQATTETEHTDHKGHNHEGECDEEHETSEHEGHDHEGESSKNNHGDEIIFSKEKADAAGVKVTTVTPIDFQQVIQTSGKITAAQGDETTIVATVSGVVAFHNRLTEGMPVSKGKSLLSLSSKHITDGDPAQRARIAYETAQKEYDRMKPLVQSKIVSEKEFALAQQAYQNARISYEALKNNYSSQGQQITSSMSGYVKALLVKEGDYVTVGQPLVSITQNRRLFLRAEVSESHYKDLRQVSSANFKTPYDNRVYELKQLNGKLLSFGKATDDNSFYLPVTFEFDNKGEVVPGSFVEVYLLSSILPNTIALPRTALSEEQGHLFVYLQLDEEGYKKQEVQIGADNGAQVQILKGIKSGDRVVTEGAYQIRLASTSNAIPAHNHQH